MLEVEVDMPVRRPSNRALRLLLATALLVPLGLSPSARAASGAASRRAPIPTKIAVSEHAPFAAGECGACHRQDGRPSSASVVKPPPGLCLDCHDDFHNSVSKTVERAAARVSCTSCHTPHNSTKAKLLL
jgi:predicted CXXCH cytochrome family protein